MKALLVAGARPNFMKVGPILAELEGRGHDGVLLHTGQHYDPEMSDDFFRDLGIRAPDHHLGVGSATHAVQTARVMEAFEPVLLAEEPDWVVVVGDVNSTLACALVAAKLRPELGCRVAHVEAGLRSRNWSMPEEVNRVLTDRLSDLLLVPSRDARPNLLHEGIEPGRIRFAGNIMIDSLLARLDDARERDVPGSRGLEAGGYAVATAHRPANVDDPEALRTLLEALRAVAGRMPVVFPVHPRTRERIRALGEEGGEGAGGAGGGMAAGGGGAGDVGGSDLRLVPPVGYTEMVGLMDGAACVLTDSGGMQEETTVLGVPCVTLRPETERPVTVEEGTNRLAPWPPTPDGIVAAFEAAVAVGGGRREVGACAPDGWDGRAASRIVDALEEG